MFVYKVKVHTFSKKKIISAIFLIIMYGYIILTNLKISNIFYINAGLRIGIFFIASLFAILFLFKSIVRGKILITDSLIIIYTIYIAALLFLGSEYDRQNIILIIFLPLMYFCGRYVYSQAGYNETFFELLNFAALLIFTGCFIYNRVLNGMLSGANTVYYQLCVLPVNIRSKNKVIRIASLFLVSFCVFFSGKRAAFLIWAVCIAYFLYILFNMEKRTVREKTVIVTAGIFVMTAFVCIFDSYIARYYGMSIVHRLMQVGADGGSGRNELLNMVFQELKNNTFFQTLFGHYMQSTASIADGMGAHNDFVELFYRCGIVGIILFLGISYKIISAIKYTKVLQNRYYVCFLCELFIFFIFMMFSQILFIASYNCFFSFEFALCISMVAKEVQIHEQI